MIPNEIKKIRKQLLKGGLRNVKAVILYGSLAKGTAREDSDVDLLAVYRRRDKKARQFIDEALRSVNMDRDFTVVHASLKDFAKEKMPVYTSAKKDGKIIFGDVDLSLSKIPPPVRYSGFFKISRDFESRKIELAQKLLADGMTNRAADYCFIASKHAIQAALAMRGKGFSSKMDILMPLAKERFGKEIASKFQKLFRIYKKSENIFADITKKDAKSAVKRARDVLKVYDYEAACAGSKRWSPGKGGCWQVKKQT